MTRNTLTLPLATLLLAVSGVVLAGENRPAHLGIFGDDVQSDAQRGGAIVREVLADSPAEKAGLKSGDIIIAVDEDAVASFEELAAIVRTHKPGDELVVKVIRQGKEQELKVQLAAAPEGAAVPRTPFEFGPDGFRFRPPRSGRPFEWKQPKGFPFQWPEGLYGTPKAERPMIGVHLQEVDAGLRQRLGLGDRAGVLIADVIPDSPAEKAGLASEDLIVEADGKKVASPQELTDLVGAKKAGDEIALTIVRDGKTLKKKIALEKMSPAEISPFLDPQGPQGKLRRETMHVVPERRLREMQQQIDQLKDKVESLTRQLERLQAKSPKSKAPAAPKKAPAKKPAGKKPAKRTGDS